MNLIKTLSFLLISCAVAHPALSQNDDTPKAVSSKSNKKYFNEFYSGLLADVLISPYTVVPNYVTTYGYPYNTYTQQGNYAFRTATVNLLSFGYKGWYNIVEFNNDASLSIGACPTLGFGIAFSDGKDSGPGGMLSGYIPILAEFHFGNGATYNAEKEIGFTIGGGIELIKSPFITVGNRVPTYTGPNGEMLQASITSAWVEPCVDAGVTFWTKGNIAVEIEAKYGFGANNTFLADDGTTSITGGSRSFRLGTIIYVGY